MIENGSHGLDNGDFFTMVDDWVAGGHGCFAIFKGSLVTAQEVSVPLKIKGFPMSPERNPSFVKENPWRIQGLWVFSIL